MASKKGKIISLTKKDIDLVFERVENIEEPDQSEYVLGLYREVYPFLDDIEGFVEPKTSEEVSLYIFQKSMAFDKKYHPQIVIGGAWMNRGFSTDRNITGWEVDQGEYRMKEPQAEASLREGDAYKNMTPFHACECAEGFGSGEDADESAVLTAWQYIADTGLWKQLQGFYSRTVRDLVLAGTIADPAGVGNPII